MADIAAWWGVGIAAVSLMISGLAYTASRASAEAARRANNIQLHAYQKEIYLAYCKFEDKVRSSPYQLNKEAVDQFEAYAESSRLYFSKELSQRITKYHKTCRVIARQIETNNLIATSLASQGHSAAQSTMDTLTGGYDSVRNLTTSIFRSGVEVRESIKSAITIVYVDKSPWQKYVEEIVRPFDWDDRSEPQ